MHPSAEIEMRRLLGLYPGTTATVLDVGSRDVNGTYRPMVVNRGWEYTGLDIEAGDNVDIVAPPYEYPFEDGYFDIVLSGSVMEHVQAVWRWVPELVRVLRPGGLLAIVTVWSYPEHKRPFDCWRILPDGFQYLFDLTGALERYDITKTDPCDIAAAAWKVSQ